MKSEEEKKKKKKLSEEKCWSREKAERREDNKIKKSTIKIAK